MLVEISQHFNAGFRDDEFQQVRQDERKLLPSLTGLGCFTHLHPALKRWAIIACEQWEIASQYAVRGRRRMDYIGRMVMRPSDREIASQWDNIFPYGRNQPN
jgi:hypothetical protein